MRCGVNHQRQWDKDPFIEQLPILARLNVSWWVGPAQFKGDAIQPSHVLSASAAPACTIHSPHGQGRCACLVWEWERQWWQ